MSSSIKGAKSCRSLIAAIPHLLTLLFSWASPSSIFEAISVRSFLLSILMISFLGSPTPIIFLFFLLSNRALAFGLNDFAVALSCNVATISTGRPSSCLASLWSKISCTAARVLRIMPTLRSIDSSVAHSGNSSFPNPSFKKISCFPRVSIN